MKIIIIHDGGITEKELERIEFHIKGDDIGANELARNFASMMAAMGFHGDNIADAFEAWSEEWRDANPKK